MNDELIMNNELPRYGKAGGVYIIDMSAGVGERPTQTRVSTFASTATPWFYDGCPRWMDVDGDGVPDLVAGRTYIINATHAIDSELVWFKNKGNNTWGDTERLFAGPGGSISLVDIDNDGGTEIISYEQHKNNRLAIYSCASGSSWLACSKEFDALITTTIVDVHFPYPPFESGSFVDLDGDGTLEILTASHQKVLPGHSKTSANKSDYQAGQIVAYSQPKNGRWKTLTWTKHVLADGYFPSPTILPGAVSPGPPIAFNFAGQDIPTIIYSLADGGGVDILRPIVPPSTSTPPAASEVTFAVGGGDYTDYVPNARLASANANVGRTVNAARVGDFPQYKKERIFTSQGRSEQGVATVGTGLILAHDASQPNGVEVFIPSTAEDAIVALQIGAN